MIIKKPNPYRVCAVCGKRHGPTYGFRNVLRHLGIVGDKAVPKCVEKLMKTKTGSKL